MTAEKKKKITLATFKSFARRNKGELFVNVNSSFDGMVDGCTSQHYGFVPVTEHADHAENTLGIPGVWLVHGSRDHFTAYDDGVYAGIKVCNCCGHFILATQNQK